MTAIRCDHTYRQKAMFTRIRAHKCDYCSKHIMVYELPCHTCHKCDKFWHSGCFQQILRNREADMDGGVVMSQAPIVEEHNVDSNTSGSPVLVVAHPPQETGAAPSSGDAATHRAIPQQQHVHDFAWKSFWTPTFCSYCDKLLVGLHKQGLECKTCDTFTHEKCIPKDSSRAIVAEQAKDVKNQIFNYHSEEEEKRMREAKGAEQLVLGNTIKMIKMVNKRNKRLPQSAINPANMLHLYKKHAELYKTAVAACPEVDDGFSTEDLLDARSILRYATAAYGRAYDEGFFASNLACVMLRFGNSSITDPKPEQNTLAVCNILGVPRSAVYYATWSGEVYKPNFFIMHDAAAKRIVLAFRGSLSDADFLTDATGELEDFTNIPAPLDPTEAAHVSDAEPGLGLAHKGISTMVQEVFENSEAMNILKSLMEKFPDHTLVVTGHSLGAGLTSLFVVKAVAEATLGAGNRHRIKGFAFAPPPTVTHPLADRFDDCLTNFVAAKDCVSRLQYNSTDRLCQEIAEHSNKSSHHEDHGEDDVDPDSANRHSDLTEECSIPGRIFLFTKPNNLNTKLINPKRTHVLLHQVFLSKYMIDNHHMDNYDKAMDAILKARVAAQWKAVGGEDGTESNTNNSRGLAPTAGGDSEHADDDDEDEGLPAEPEEHEDDDCEHNEKSWRSFAALAADWTKEKVQQAGETVSSGLGGGGASGGAPVAESDGTNAAKPQEKRH